MTLEINGKMRTIPPVASVRELLTVLGIEGTQVAVELNRTIVRRAEWDATPIADRDRVEIVQFVGGG
ncbi:MAG: sulfur carrier protein ThiS [Acidobacteria bacterium]|nr:sulfur carrier protein ThiS [Acidobacteriota bacterium]